jgi:pilus assembly protein CpaF
MVVGPAWASGASIFSESLRAFLSPVSQFLDDPSVSEILINGPDEVWIEREGKLTRTSERFTEDGLLAAARNMAQFVGRPLSEQHPRLDARLPDGSRIHVVLPPLARCGTVVSIRKFHPGGLSIDEMLENQSLTTQAARMLEVLVLSKKNLIVAGGTGSGKTTLLNVLSQFIPDEERILTIEDSAELQLDQEHLVPLESRPPDAKGKGGIGIRDLVHSALRLRPDRLIIGEVRGGECFDLLQAMNTGHDGTMSTVHANGPQETLNRLESLALLADTGLPLRAMRAQIAAAIDVVVCTARLRDGSRRLTAISEVLPLDDRGDYRVQDLFIFTQVGLDDTGRIHGYLAPTGVVPTFEARLVAEGFDDMVESFFMPETHGYVPPRYFNGKRRPLRSIEAAGAIEPESTQAEIAIAFSETGMEAQGEFAAPEEQDTGKQRHMDTEPRLDMSSLASPEDDSGQSS